jgi:hypothetical protein
MRRTEAGDLTQEIELESQLFVEALLFRGAADRQSTSSAPRQHAGRVAS